MTVLKCVLLAAILLVSARVAEAQTYINGGAPGPQTTVGWNFGTIAYCSAYSDGPNTWLIVVTGEGGYGYTNNPALQAIIAPGCQTGGQFAVFVVSLNPFRWDQIVLYPFL